MFDILQRGVFFNLKDRGLDRMQKIEGKDSCGESTERTGLDLTKNTNPTQTSELVYAENIEDIKALRGVATNNKVYTVFYIVIVNSPKIL